MQSIRYPFLPIITAAGGLLWAVVASLSLTAPATAAATATTATSTAPDDEAAPAVRAPAAPERPPRYVAHAGGEVAGVAGSNSLEALDESLARGHSLVELDLSWTSDGHLVLFHDWDIAPETLLSERPRILSRAEFRAARSNRGLTHIDLPALADWLRGHAGLDVVVDVKGRAQAGWAALATGYPDLAQRFIPQIYDLDEYDEARALGFERIILTLYASAADDDAVVAFARGHELFAVTMPVARAKGGLPRRLAAVDVFTYAHTVDEYLVVSDLFGRGVGGVYTSLLSPRTDGRDRREGAWPEWSVQHLAEGGPLAERLIPFVPPTGFGLWPHLRLANGSDQLEPVRLIALDGRGQELARQDVQLQPGEESTLPLWTAFGGLPVRALRIAAWRGVTVDPRLEVVGRPDVPWDALERSHRVFVAKGPADGLFSQVLVVMNPTKQRQVYTMVRTIAGKPVDEERILLEPGRQALRVLPIASYGPPPAGSEVVLRVFGGPMLAWHLRIDPMMSFLR